MAFVFAFPALFVIQMAFTDVSLKRINPEDPELGFDWAERKFIIKNSIIMLSFVLITAVGSVASNVYVLGYLLISAKNPATFEDSQKGNKDAQKRLFIFTAIMLFNHLAFAAMQVSCHLFKILRQVLARNKPTF